MNTPRFLRSFLVRGMLVAALSSTPLFAISKEELAALRAKAENGNGIAQYNLGLLYAAIGDPLANPIEAYVWFNLAADNGATGRALVLLSSQMNPEQVAEAKQRLDARRQELEAKKKRLAANPTNPVSATESNPTSSADSGSPIFAAPAQPDPPISAAPISEREFAAAQAELKKISGELSNAWKENEQLKAALAKGNFTSAAAEQLQRERDQLLTAVASASEDLAKLRAQKENWENERNSLREKIASAGQAQKENSNTEVAALTSKLRAAESQLVQATAAGGELANAKQQIGSLSDQVQKLTAENQRLNGLASQAGSSAESKAAAEKELAALRNELSSTQSQLTAAKSANATNSGTQKQLEDTQIKLESALRSFELQQKDVANLQKALANIDSEREGLAKQLADLKAASGKPDRAAEQRIAQLTTELESAKSSKAEVAQLQQQLSDGQAKLKAAEDALARTHQENDQLGKQLAVAQATPAVPSGEIARLNTELKDARTRLGAAEHALTATKEERDRTMQEAARSSEQKVAQLTSELQQLRQKATAGDQAVASAAQERDHLKQQLARASAAASAASELAPLQARLKSTEEALAAAQAERADLTKRLTDAENKANAVPVVSTVPSPSAGEDPAELRKELTDMQSKLTAALRTYQLQQDELDRLQKALANIDGERAQLAERAQNSDLLSTQARAQATANQEAAAQLAAVREQFRQAQNQIAALAGENSQLKNRLSLAGPPPGPASTGTGTLSPPARPTSTGGGTATVASIGAGATPAARVTAAPPTRPALPLLPRIHTVADGDTLSKIARRYYGNAERWPQILEANRSSIKDVNNLILGTTLKIP